MFIFLVCHYLNIFVMWCFFHISCYFTNISCLLKITENSKKGRHGTSSICWLICILVWMSPFSCLYFHIHACVKFCALNVRVMFFFFSNKVGIIALTRNYYFTISLKGGSVEILARSSIFPESQTKVNVKVTASR